MQKTYTIQSFCSSNKQAIEHWLHQRLHDSSSTLSNALTPEWLTGSQKNLNDPLQSCDGDALLKDSLKVQFQVANGNQKFIILHSAPVCDWFAGQPDCEALVSLARMCGSKDGVSFYQKEDIQTTNQWSTIQVQKVQEFLRLNSFNLLDQALELSKGDTYVLFSFLGLNEQDFYANVPISSLYDYLIPQSVDANKELWLTTSADTDYLSSSSGLILIPKISLQKIPPSTPEHPKKNDAFDLMLAIDVETLLKSLKQGAIKRARIFEQERSKSSILYESQLPGDALHFWNQESLAFEKQQCAQIAQKLKKQQIQNEIYLKTSNKSPGALKQHRSTFNALQKAPDFFKIAWMCGAISKKWIANAQLERPLLPDGTYGHLTDAQWKKVFKIALQTRLVSTQLFQKGVDSRRFKYQKALEQYAHHINMHTFINVIYTPPISKKMQHTLCAIYNAFFKDAVLLSSAKYLLQKGYNAQKLLGWSNLDTKEQNKAKMRLLALVQALQSGTPLQSAIDKIGTVFERSQFEALVHSRKLKGVPILLDDVSKKTEVIAKQLGWKSDGRNVQLLRSCLRFSSPQDQNLIIKAVQSGLSIQKDLQNWTSGSSNERDRMRRVMNVFAADTTLFNEALKHGEAHLLERQKYDQYVVGLAQKILQAQALSEHARPHVVALFRACKSKEHADLIFNCVNQGLSVSKLYGIGKITDSKMDQVIQLLEQFLVDKNDEQKKRHLLNQLDTLTERPITKVKRQHSKKVLKF